MALPTRGQPDWDDELGNHIAGLEADTQSAKANASAAISAANAAINIAQGVQGAVVAPAANVVAGFVADGSGPVGQALSTTIGASVASGVAPLRTAARLNVPRVGQAPITRMFLPANPLSNGPWNLEGGGLSAGDSSLTSTERVLLGTTSAKIVTTGTGGTATAQITPPSAIDMTNDDLRIWFYLEPEASIPGGATEANLSNFKVECFDAAFAGYGANFYGGISPTMVGFGVQPGLNVVDIPFAAMTGGSNPAAIVKIRVGFADRSGRPVTVHVHGVATVKRAHTGLFQSGVISLTADDSFGTQWSVLRPALDKYGWRATLFPIIDQIDAPGNLTMAQVRSLKDDYGWEIAAHSTTGLKHAQGLVNMTHDERMTELEALRTWLDSIGSESTTFAYPLGSHNAAAQDDVAQFFSVGRGAIINHIGPQYPANKYNLQSINAGSQSARILTDSPTTQAKTVSGKAWTSVTYHAFPTSGGTSNDVTPTVLGNQLAAIAASGATVLPMGEVIRTLSA